MMAMIIPKPNILSLAIVLAVLCMATVVYAKALHNQTGIPDLGSTVFGFAPSSDAGSSSTGEGKIK